MLQKHQKHKGKKSRDQPIKLECSHCSYVWDYYGKINRYGTNCPRCHSWVTIPPDIRKIPPKKPQQKTTPGINVSCYKCGGKWVYSGKYVDRIAAGQLTAIICPICGSKIKLP